MAKAATIRLSSPNGMIWRYFRMLRRLAASAQRATDEDEAKEITALCIILGVTVVEAFLNIYFRVLVSESGFAQHHARIQADLDQRRSLEYKLRHWPAAVLGRSIDRSLPAAKAFDALKSRRNRLMHFTSSHATAELPGMALHGLADISVYDTLVPADASTALETAENMLLLLFRLRGIPETRLPQELHSWTGMPAG